MRLLDRNSRRWSSRRRARFFLSRSRSVLAQLDRTMMELRSRKSPARCCGWGLPVDVDPAGGDEDVS